MPPLKAFLAEIALPFVVLGPVDSSQGRHVPMIAAWRKRLCVVQPCSIRLIH